MNNFLLSLSFICLSFSKLTTGLVPAKQPTSLENDLFESPENIKVSWLGELQSAKTKKSFNNIPMFIYRNAQMAYAKIICIPKQPASWDAKFKGKNAAQKISITKTLTQGIITHSFGEKTFVIYAFLQQNDDKKISVNKNNNLTVFPATIYIYKNTGTKWNSIGRKIVANSSSYQQLQYDTAHSATIPII